MSPFLGRVVTEQIRLDAINLKGSSGGDTRKKKKYIHWNHVPEPVEGKADKHAAALCDIIGRARIPRPRPYSRVPRTEKTMPKVNLRAHVRV